MNRYQKTSIIGIGLFGLYAGYFVLSNQTAKSAERPHHMIEAKSAPPQEVQLRSPSMIFPAQQNKIKKTIADSDDPKNWWPEYQPLSKEEEREFEIVITQVGRYYDWGEMEKESLPAFRGTLGAYNERAVAHIVRTLANLKRDTLKSEVEAEGVTRQLDFLRYMADDPRGFTFEAVKKLATKKLSTEVEKTDQTELQITLEAFQVFTLANHEEALEYISTEVSAPLKRAYAYNYWLGRKLSKISESEAMDELKERLGDQFLSDKQKGVL